MTMTDRTKQPEIKEIDDIKLPSPKKDTLSNGIRTYCFENPNLDLIYLLLQFRTGTLHQTKKHVCQYAFQLLRESSRHYMPEEMEERLDFFGTNITTNIGLDKVQVMITIPKRNIGNILPDICDFLTNPAYRENSLQLYKERELKNLAYNEQKTDFLSWRLLWRELFGKSLPEIFKFSSPETINAVNIGDLATFQRAVCCAENMTLFFTGNIDNETEKIIYDNFSRIPQGEKSAAPPVIQPWTEGRTIYQEMPGCLQSSIVLCVPMAGYNDPERSKFSVLSTIAGGYFGSRLMQKLRERQGFTYGVSAASAYFGSQSVFAISSDVNAKDTAAAVDSCFEELELLQKEPVPQKELATVKTYMTGLNLRSIDTSVNAMQKFATYHHFGLDETEMERNIAEIKEVAADDIQDLAKKHFSYNKFNRIIVGENRE